MWRYSYNLLEGLLEHDREHSFCCVYGVDNAGERELEALKERFSNLQLAPIPQSDSKSRRKRGMLLDFFSRLPSESFSEGSLVHGTSNYMPLFGREKRILTLHDLLQAFPPQGPLEKKSIYGKIRRLFYRWQTGLLAKRAQVLITDHENTKSQIEEVFHCSAEVIYPSLHTIFLEGEVARREKELDGTFRIMALASTDGRKNIRGTLRALQLLEVKDNVQLSILAHSERSRRMCEEWIGQEQPSFQAEIFFDVHTDELASFYAEHDLLVYPSFGEGFGYPIYEALTQHVPVVASEGLLVKKFEGQLENVVKECDPCNPSTIAKAIEGFLNNPVDDKYLEQASCLVKEELHPRKLAEKVLNLYSRLS